MLVFGLLSCYTAMAVLLFAVLKPAAPRLPMERRRPTSAGADSVLSRMTGIASGAIDDFLVRHGWTRSVGLSLEHAGLHVSPADFLILAIAATFMGGLIGLLLGGLIFGLVMAIVVGFGARLALRFLAARRRRAFANQLEDSLQLLSGSLRAGHSLLRAVDAVSDQSDSPTSEEFARIVNETHLGRDLDEALEQTVQRMQSTDLSWVAQAIGIHREVGGDLAEVLDQVGSTIRERNKIKRQVKALSAEGKMSAYVLLALPVLIIGVLSLMSPQYMAKFVESPLGYAMIAGALVMIAVGGFWMMKLVSFKF